MKKKVFPFVILAVLFSLCFVLSASAEEDFIPLAGLPNRLSDRSDSTGQTVSELTLTPGDGISSLYLIFFDTPTAFSVILEDGTEWKKEPNYLHSYFELEKEITSSFTLRFAEPSRLCGVYAFAKAVPDWVQIWDAPCEKADLLLLSTHADDEQLFFSGLLPMYAGEKKLAVQVVYLTDHSDQPVRRHELLNGLWTVGVRHYPHIGWVPDLYGTSREAVIRSLSGRGVTEESVLAFEVEVLRRYQPKVVIGHDLAGEYGHGMHIVNSTLLVNAVPLAADPNSFPESAALYGTWDTPKLYLHLYKENAIHMDWDTPLNSFGGKTAYQVSQDGFMCHKSQHWTWFYRWMIGEGKKKTSVTEIDKYSPCDYGLYRTLVGEDVEKHDFMENVTSYAQDERIREEEQRLEEEMARLEKEREEALREKEELDQKLSEIEENAAKLAERQKKAIFQSLLLYGGSAILLIVLLVFFVRKHKKKVK